MENSHYDIVQQDWKAMRMDGLQHVPKRGTERQWKQETMGINTRYLKRAMGSNKSGW